MGKYDVIVIGGGSAGFNVLQQLQGQGLKVAVAENRKLGGACPNFACVPSKALLKCAEILHTAENTGRFGIKTKEVTFDWQKVQEYRADKVARTISAKSDELLKKWGIDLLWGTAKFISPYEIEVDGKRYQAGKFAITTGSTVNVPDIEGLRETGFINSDQAVELKKLPQSLIILGAGAVGVELGQVFARFKIRVTIINRKPRILDREELEITKLAQKHLEADGVKFVLGANFKKITKRNEKKVILLEVSGQLQELEAEEILVATGRVPNIGSLALENANIPLKNHKAELNEFLQTSEPHIFIAGDAAGFMQYTHVADYEGFAVGRNILGKKFKPDHRVIPRGVFIDPEIGSVGITSEQAKAQGYETASPIFPYGAARAQISSDPKGLIKLILDKKTRKFLGASAIGNCAAEFIHLIALAMQTGLTADQAGTLIYAYPTYAESLGGVNFYLEY